MKINRTNNAIRNVFFGFGLKIYQLIFPFIIRTAMIHCLGVQYLGLSSLFASILSVLNLAELGVGSAMVYSMYSPIANDDTDMICALMKLYRRYYRIIGLIIAISGLLLLPFIPKLITGKVPSDINVYFLYLLNLGNTVFSYWLFAYRGCLLNAHQRTDVISKISIVVLSIQYALQLVAIVLLDNFYLYIIVSLIGQIITNIITALFAYKYYPQYRPVGNLCKNVVKNINTRIRDLFTAKIGGVVVNSVDTIVISAFLGLEMLAIYQNYFYILTAGITIISIVFNSCTAGVGNSLIVESKEKNYHDLKKFTVLVSWLAGLFSCELLCLYQLFMKMWVGEELVLNEIAVIFLVIYFCIYEYNQLFNLYKDAGGIWREDRFRPLVTAFVNLSLNLLSVRLIGIYGVIISTVASTLFVGAPWLINNLFSTIFERKHRDDYIKQVLYSWIVIIMACCFTKVLTSLISMNNIYILILKGVVVFIFYNIIFYVFYRNRIEYNILVNYISDFMKNRAKNS